MWYCLLCCTRLVLTFKKAIEQYFHVVLFIMLYKVVLTFKKAIEQYFHVVLFIMLYNEVLAFKSVDHTLVCDHLNKSY